jgi:hypothetical protein
VTEREENIKWVTDKLAHLSDAEVVWWARFLADLGGFERVNPVDTRDRAIKLLAGYRAGAQQTWAVLRSRRAVG